MQNQLKRPNSMKALFTFFSILTVSLGYSQDVYWHQQLGSDTEETATAIASDADGNVFTTIRFSGTTTVGDTTFTSNGVNDIALVKLDENGEFVSAYHFGGSYDEYSLDLETDASGNVYWVGSSGGLDFAGTTYATQGGMDCMIAKWDNDLEPMWAKLGGSSQADRLYDCTVDAVGNVYFIGYMRENAVFDGISLSGL